MGKNEGREQEKVNTIVGGGATFRGHAHIEGNMWIEGTLYGDVVCSNTLTVAEGGHVDANVRARDIVIGGTVRGDIHGENRVTLQSSARLQGELSAMVLIVEEGAALQADCGIGKDEVPFPLPALQASRGFSARYPSGGSG